MATAKKPVKKAVSTKAVKKVVTKPAAKASPAKSALVKAISRKADLIEGVATAFPALSKSASASVVSFVLDTIQTSAKKNGKLTLVGFGTFSVKKRPARTGRNPKTGASMKIKAKNVLRFKAAKAFAEAVQ
jgi:DNA-binding protein HU-beta